MSFLEVVAAVAILALLAATTSSVTSFVQGSASRQAQRLGAAELANRLMLQYMDDQDAMPRESEPLDYDRFRYRWSYDETRVQVELNESAGEAAQPAGGFSVDRMQLVTVRVWLAPEAGGSFDFDDRVPSMVLKRLVDPLGFANPDSTENLLQSDQGIQDLIRTIMELDGGTIDPGNSGGRNSGGGGR